jgi:outer membrane protein OmpA-like peptidoglycan-associated protein
VALMKSNPALKLEIDGHTDNVGAHDYNVKLSQDRAAAVVAALKTAGVDATRLSSNGFGPDKPIADEATAEGRAKNRRVELVKR